MSTYDEIIPLLSNELRDEEAWPTDSSKKAEQVNLLYQAAIAVAKDIPLGRLNLVDSAALTEITTGEIYQYDIKEIDLCSFREDDGLAYLILDGQQFPFSQAISEDAMLKVSGGLMHENRILFSLNLRTKVIYASNITELKLRHVKDFTPPVSSTTGSTNSSDTLLFPLQPGNDTERVIHIVAAHVSGVTIKDPAGAQFQALLEEIYGD